MMRKQQEFRDVFSLLPNDLIMDIIKIKDGGLHTHKKNYQSVMEELDDEWTYSRGLWEEVHDEMEEENDGEIWSHFDFNEVINDAWWTSGCANYSTLFLGWSHGIRHQCQLSRSAWKHHIWEEVNEAIGFVPEDYY